MVDETSLFLHVLAATGMLGGGIAQVLAGVRLRATRTGDQVATWATFTRQAGFVIAASAVVSLLTGGHLAGAVWTTDSVSGFSFPFITLGAIGLVALAPVGPMVGGAKLRRLADEARALEDDRVPDALVARANAASLWGPVHSLVGVGVGLVALMTYKPGWATGAVLLLVTFGLGWVAGVLATDPRSAPHGG